MDGKYMALGVIIVLAIIIAGSYIVTLSQRGSGEIIEGNGKLVDNIIGSTVIEKEMEIVEPLLRGIVVTTCGVLHKNNEHYYLDLDIEQKESADCLIIEGNNVTLDCNGHMITTPYPLKASIVATNRKVTVQNCVIRGDPKGYGMNLRRVHNGSFINNTLEGMRTGIWFSESSQSNVISQNTFTTNFDGLLIQNSNNNSIQENIFSRQTRYGFHNLNSDTSVIENNGACDSALKDFYCTKSKTISGSGNRFNSVEDCTDGWPKGGEHYTPC